MQLTDVESWMSGELLGMLVGYLGQVFLALVGLGAAWMLGSWFGGAIRRVFDDSDLDPTFGRFLGRLVQWGVFGLAVLVCLGAFGVETTSVAALLGGAGVATGFALQGTVGNLSAGGMLVALRPFRVGDLVHIAGDTGRVVAVDLFFTKIDTLDNKRVVMPNKQVIDAPIENWTINSTRRVSVPVGVAYDTDLERAEAVLVDAVQDGAHVLAEPSPRAVLTGFGGSSIDFEVWVWCASDAYVEARHETILAVKKALDNANIEIPYPQMDLHLERGALELAAK